MELYYNPNKKYISVWLTKEEQKLYDRKILTSQILQKIKNSKCKVIFFLSGKGDLQKNTENLLIINLKKV